MPKHIALGLVLLMGPASLAFLPPAWGQTLPLHQRIDEHLAQTHVGPSSPLASDADFVRRVYLDLVGTIPSTAEARAFFADASPDKRAKLIDQLLASSRHAQHLANVLDVMLMERRPDKYVPAADWQKYLYESALANKPYDVLVREILSSDGTDPATRPAAKFMLEREAEPNLLARDAGRVFFGVDLQCAQCHDHPLVDDYYQADYYGLFAFFSRTQLFTFPDPDKRTVLMDNAAGEASFQSVFDATAKGNTLPRVPGGRQIDEQHFPAGQEWTVAPAKDTRHVPKYIRRLQLAAQATAPTNRQFSRNIVNRIWAQILGRGLVEPVDLHHSGNPPTHPQLLEMLADEFVASKYDLRLLIRELALTQAYQRSLELPADLAAQAASVSGLVPTLEPEQARLDAAAAQSLSAQRQASDEWAAARKTIPPVVEELTKAAAPIPDAQKAIDAAAKALSEAQGQMTAKQDVAKLLIETAAKAKEATAKLPDEKELATAATVFQARADQVQAEVAALTKSVEEKTAASKAATDQLAAINKGIEEINLRVSAARQQVIALEAKHLAAAEQSRADRFQAKLALRRVNEAKSQAAYASAASAVTTARASANKLSSDLAAAKALSAKLATELPAMQAIAATAQKANDDAVSALSAAKQAFEAKEAVRKELAEVLATAEAAAAKLPQDAELAQATQAIKARTVLLTTESVEAQKTLAAKDELTKAAAAQLAAATETVTAATTQMSAAEATITTLEPQLAPAQQQAVATAEAERQLAGEFADRWARDFATRSLRQLSPEQFGWSVLRATGVYENYVAASAAEIEKSAPLSEAAKGDPAQLAERQRKIGEDVHTKLAPSVVVFVQLFGAGVGQPQSDFFATVDQALFLANGGVVKGWLAPSGDNLTGRLLKLEDPSQIADELYVSVLTRLPTDAEKGEVAKYLAARPTDKPLALQELAWALLSSAEFRFNH